MRQTERGAEPEEQNALPRRGVEKEVRNERIARQRRWNGRTRDKMRKVKRREEHTLRKPLFSHKNNNKPTVLIIVLSVTR